MTPDEARLRESVERVRAFRERMRGLLLMEGRTLDPIDLDALLDALSAEREQADRAVGLLRACKPIVQKRIGSSTHPQSGLLALISQIDLATQKAEGA